MEKHLFICDRCGKETSFENIYVISRKYTQSHYDIVDGEYEGTTNEEDKYHICKKCFDKVKSVIFNK